MLDGKKVKAQSASINAVVSEGRLNWDVSIDCGMIELDGCEWEISTGAEWIHWPVSSWADLDGVSLQSCTNLSEVESSFYLAQHHDMDIHKLHIKKTNNCYTVDFVGEFELCGFGNEFDGKVAVDLSTELILEGIIVVPDNMFPKPSTPEEVQTLVEPLFDMPQLGQPQKEGFRYILNPV